MVMHDGEKVLMKQQRQVFIFPPSRQRRLLRGVAKNPHFLW
jgi:hypothetical protein